MLFLRVRADRIVLVRDHTCICGVTVCHHVNGVVDYMLMAQCHVTMLLTIK